MWVLYTALRYKKMLSYVSRKKFIARIDHVLIMHAKGLCVLWLSSIYVFKTVYSYSAISMF